MREVNFSVSAFICAIKTSNRSKLQAPQLRNTFDLSTSILPPVVFHNLIWVRDSTAAGVTSIISFDNYAQDERASYI